MPHTKTVITIELDQQLAPEVKKELAELFADALHEFKGNRLPIYSYFERNYGNKSVYKTEAEKARKMAQIDRRVTLAGMLHNPVLRLEVKEEEVPDKFEPGSPEYEAVARSE